MSERIAVRPEAVKPSEIREWARVQGYPVAVVGNVSLKIRALYAEAHRG